MIPRHVRIKKLPAKHKQSEVSEGGGAGRRDSGQRGGRAAAARGGAAGRAAVCGNRPTLSKAWGLAAEEAEVVAKHEDSPSPSAQARPGVSEPQRLQGEQGAPKRPITGL